jgi:hypothetical protein
MSSSSRTPRTPTLASEHFNSKKLAKIFEGLLTRPQLHAIENESGAIHYEAVPGSKPVPEENKERLELAGKVLAYALTMMEYELTADTREAEMLLKATVKESSHDTSRGYS